MGNLYCEKCGQGTPQNMRICPQCGGRSFSSNPVALHRKTKQIAGTNPPPYASVSSTGFGAPRLAQGIPAEHLPRLLAAIIDSVLSQGAVYIVILVLVQILSPQAAPGTLAATFIAAMVVATLYYSLQHSSVSQATVGKRLMGLKLITLSGEPVSFALSVWRAVLPSIIFVSATAIFGAAAFPIIMLADNAPQVQTSATSSFFVIYILMIFVPVLLVFGNPERKTLFDFICKTRVIQA